ncbi:hypothetical protein [Rhizobium sp. 9140]|uniref:hypothetical protein n=1 Tax=Rhizobium sp. 9140 TaxID=1761900 RepID=UPI00079667EA|nr:hypothetical protein [Rhizobium sp. 9140]CZT36154.1 hypothetical protein GA0004734_00031560 [Rhizobium sp. 9140]
MTGPLSDRDREKARLVRHRDIAMRCEGDAWLMEADSGGVTLITQRSSGESVAIARITLDALPDEIELLSAALDTVRFYGPLVLRAADTVLRLQGIERQKADDQRRRDPAQRAAILCGDVRFHRFLEMRSGLGPVPDKAAADTRLKSLLAISSKTELRDDADALARFRKLDSDYELWWRGARI